MLHPLRTSAVSANNVSAVRRVTLICTAPCSVSVNTRPLTLFTFTLSTLIYPVRRAMVSHVRIKPAYSPKPHKYRMFDVNCYHHHFRTTVTATPGVVRDWIFKMRRRHSYHLRRRKLMVGLGVQWRASSPIPGYTNPAATLQLAVGHECLIFQLTRALRAPRSLRRLLEDPEITRVGVNNHRDVAELESTELGLCVGKVVDLVDVARDEGICRNQVSMEVLVEKILEMEGINKPEEVGRSNWEAELLSEEQVEYACLDASLSFLMGKALEAWDWTH